MALAAYPLRKMSQDPRFAHAWFAGDLDEAMLVARCLKISKRTEAGEIDAANCGPDLRKRMARHFRQFGTGEREILTACKVEAARSQSLDERLARDRASRLTRLDDDFDVSVV
ncbi:hypothetical protein EV663_12917 [Rhodovulum bhavnagarense]|uniref:Uncharacterized protein n=1 Tax=Rhodovulum bhavnagarense TaxID=992286 RepID=A0A4V2SVM2_9RHOB|nr:hypothetical protein [Rhodovulum bhavnagarense]TCP58406.1 hypothetical protein EV663_12917 [Rhodovulum bhavnagarense]